MKEEIVDGYVFEKVKPYKNIVCWVCKNKNCNVRLHTEGETYEKSTGSQLYALNHNYNYEVQFSNEIDASVSIFTFESAKSAYYSSLRKLTEFYQTKPLKDTIICNLRSFDILQDEPFPFTLNKDLCKTADGNLLIFLTNLFEHNEILLADKTFIRSLMLENYSINMDGTFKSCPRTFYQPYIIHVVESSQFFPVFYCFLKKKTQQHIVPQSLFDPTYVLRDVILTSDKLFGSVLMMMDFKIFRLRTKPFKDI
ncbi:hypothetical protein MXB_4472, partial [Myxobolus squamalis]